MGITQIINQYYEVIHPFKAAPSAMMPGQFAWVPALFVEQVPYVFEFERATPTSHTDIKFKIRNMSPSDFTLKQKLPVAGLPLNDTEECLAIRAKKRPCILLAKNLTLELPSDANGVAPSSKKHLLHDAALFMPLYGIQDADHAGGFPQAMVDRIKVLMYEQFFFFKQGTLPSSSRNFLIENSVGRFDRIFISTLLHPGVSPLDGKLTSEAWNVLVASLARYLKVPLEQEQADTFAAIIELVQEALPKNV